jgi:hypothetical protein
VSAGFANRCPWWSYQVARTRLIVGLITPHRIYLTIIKPVSEAVARSRAMLCMYENWKALVGCRWQPKKFCCQRQFHQLGTHYCALVVVHMLIFLALIALPSVDMAFQTQSSHVRYFFCVPNISHKAPFLSVVLMLSWRSMFCCHASCHELLDEWWCSLWIHW